MTEAVLVFAAVFAVSAAAPGADTMLMFGRALAGGARSAVPVAVGITAGKLVLLVLAATGVTAAAAALGPLFVAVKLAGPGISCGWACGCGGAVLPRRHCPRRPTMRAWGVGSLRVLCWR
jgi:hypothetical protein